MTEKTPPAKPRRAASAQTSTPRAKSSAKAEHQGDRIAKVLSRAGIASRREAERLIEAGEVTVNGKVVTSPALNVTDRDRITVSGRPVGAAEPARLWLYYKPEGLVTSASDEKGRDTVFDHLPEDMPRVMSVGRLDLNSEGLLLLTNDGGLKRQLELPSTGWLRKYRVRVKGNPTDPELDPLRKGITVEGERFQPMDVVLDRHQGSNAWLTIGLREGKNREIRRAINAIGMIVNRLIRVSYGPFRLNDLQPGDVEEVRPRVLKEQLGSLLPDQPKAEAKPRPTGVTRSRASGARAPDPGEKAPGTVRTARAKAGLKSLGKAWSEATETPAKGPRRENASKSASAESGRKAKTVTPRSRPSPTETNGGPGRKPRPPRKG